MASVAKYTDTASDNIIRHIERTIQTPSNKNIDSERSHLNYNLHSTNRDGKIFLSSKNYFEHRKKEVHYLKRADVKTLCGWVITLPKDIPPNEHKAFFTACHSYLISLYGEENIVSSVCHLDEETPHLHCLFLPIVRDKKKGGEKVCAKEVLTRQHLREFHPALEKHLQEHGISTKILSGITASQGGNRTVKELKKERLKIHSHERGVFIGR